MNRRSILAGCMALLAGMPASGRVIWASKKPPLQWPYTVTSPTYRYHLGR